MTVAQLRRPAVRPADGPDRPRRQGAATFSRRAARGSRQRELCHGGGTHRGGGSRAAGPLGRDPGVQRSRARFRCSAGRPGGCHRRTWTGCTRSSRAARCQPAVSIVCSGWRGRWPTCPARTGRRTRKCSWPWSCASSGPAGTGRMRAPEAERVARAALSRLAEPGDVALFSLVREAGAAGTLAAIRDGSAPLKAIANYRTRLSCGPAPEADLERAECQQIRFVVPGDLEWPSQLGDLELAAGPRQAAAAPPLGLWVRGAESLRIAALRSVAVVGSRAATAYGTRVASDLGRRSGRPWLCRGVRRCLRHRRRGAPGGARGGRHHGVRAGFGGRRALPGRAPGAVRPGRCRRDPGQRAATGIPSHQGPVPRPQPADRRAHPRHGRCRGCLQAVAPSTRRPGLGG